MGTAMERPHVVRHKKAKFLTTEAGFLLPRDHRVRFPDSATFVAGSLQTLVGDFRPRALLKPRSSPCACVFQRHSVSTAFNQAPVTRNSIAHQREGMIFMQLGGVPLIQIKRIYHAASRHGREMIEQRGRLPFLGPKANNAKVVAMSALRG